MVNYCTIFYQSISLSIQCDISHHLQIKNTGKIWIPFFGIESSFYIIKLLILWSNWYYFYYNFFETSSLLTKNVSEFRFLELKWDCDGYLVSTVYLFKKIRSMHFVNKHITVNLHQAKQLLLNMLTECLLSQYICTCHILGIWGGGSLTFHEMIVPKFRVYNSTCYM